MEAKLNVLGEPLTACSEEPLTGFFRDGCCNTSREDVGLHVVCTRVTAEFLEFSRDRGNDLSTHTAVACRKDRPLWVVEGQTTDGI